MLNYSPTPTQELFEDNFLKAGVRLFVKREDLNHPTVSGNKWWKLKYNLEEAIRLQSGILLTYGGAYSNHIYATSAAAKLCGLKSIGIIRGEETLPLNPVLEYAQANGMHLLYMSRHEFRNKYDQQQIDSLKKEFGDFYLIPEGGSNELALKGVREFALSLSDSFEYLCCAVGTGATLAGIVSGLQGKKSIIGFTMLKGEGWEAEVESFQPGYANWHLTHHYHEGGYSKSSPSLLKFMKEFTLRHDIPLEHVYTGKLFKGILDMISGGYFPRGSRILALHSGGIHSF